MTLLKRRFSVSQPASDAFSAEEIRGRCFQALLARTIRVLSLVSLDCYHGTLAGADHPALFREPVPGRACKALLCSKTDASLVAVVLLHVLTRV